MISLTKAMFIAILFIAFTGQAAAQADDICRELGIMPTLEAPKLGTPIVYGRVTLRGYDTGSKLPRVTVTFSEGRTFGRATVGNSGNYCFRRITGSDGTLVVDLDGAEVARKSINSFGPPQQREDFEVFPPKTPGLGPPAVISSKFSHPPNEKTIELYKRAGEAERNNDPTKLIEYVKEIVGVDPTDFIAWAKLGSLYFERGNLSNAEAAFRKSLELKQEYTLAWIYMGKIRVAQKQFEAAIEIFKHAITLEPSAARTFQLLGEAYLRAQQGTLGAAALNEAIKLDPVGMAECHLLLAQLYELAGAKTMAAREYKMFLKKVANHPDKKKFEKFIKDNPE
jgi:tetratricopeptide (TPR) repeat protein